MPRIKKEIQTAKAYLPEERSLDALRAAAAGCRACPLWENATQTVFGEGRADAPLILVGEQPGDQEDKKGHPFVGPAGRILDRALDQAGIRREDAFITNVVKHFKWVAKGRRRLHQKPNAREIGACLPWLEAEIDALRPKVLVAMGATAAQAIGGPEVRVTKDRGRRLESPLAPCFTVTMHPSAILRVETQEQQEEAMRRLVADLREVEWMLRKGPGRS
jgi:DNA polymerase